MQSIVLPTATSELGKRMKDVSDLQTRLNIRNNSIICHLEYLAKRMGTLKHQLGRETPNAAIRR